MTQQDASSPDMSSAASSLASSGSSGLPSIVSVSAVKQCIVEPLSPADGGEFIAQAILNAQQSIWLEMYLLTHSRVIDALAQVATPDPTTGMKKDIRIILEKLAYPFSAANAASTASSPSNGAPSDTSAPAPTSPLSTVAHTVSSWFHGSTASHQVPTYQMVKQRLNDAGIEVRANSTLMWGGKTHAKYMLIDGQIAYIMTANLTTDSIGSPAAHGNPYPAHNREYIVIDGDQGRINTLKAIFSADWDANAPRFDASQLQSSALVVSPSANNQGNASTIVLQLLHQAQTSLMIEMEEIHESPLGVIEQALIDAAARNVQVQVILPDNPTSGKATTPDDINALTNGNVQLRTSAKPIMHAKMILVDAQFATGTQQVTGGLAFIGSQNLTTAGLNQSREIGITISDVNVLNMLWQSFTLDWNNAQPL